MFYWRQTGGEPGKLVRNIVLTNAGDYFVLYIDGEGEAGISYSGPMRHLAFDNDGADINPNAGSTPMRGDLRLEPDEENGEVVRDLFMAPVADGASLYVRRFGKRIRDAFESDPVAGEGLVFASRDLVVQTPSGNQEGTAIFRNRSTNAQIGTADLEFQYTGGNLTTSANEAKNLLQLAGHQGAYSHIASTADAVYAVRADGRIGTVGRMVEGSPVVEAISGSGWEGQIASVTVLAATDTTLYARLATYRLRQETTWSRIPNGTDPGSSTERNVHEAFSYRLAIVDGAIVEVVEEGSVQGSAVDTNGDSYPDTIEYVVDGVVTTAVAVLSDGSLSLYSVPADSSPTFTDFALEIAPGIRLVRYSNGTWELDGLPFNPEGSRLAYSGQSAVRRDLRVSAKTQSEMGI
ncbi:MAG: hypothetical protein CMQ40_10735 [Gammaproteobacteria bacterium]|nr:hypothetical protein [Gammaproteobacteria bacterium]